MLIRVISGNHHNLGQGLLCSCLGKAARVHDAGLEGVIILVPDGDPRELEKLLEVGVSCEDITEELYALRHARAAEAECLANERRERLACCVAELQRRAAEEAELERERRKRVADRKAARREKKAVKKAAKRGVKK